MKKVIFSLIMILTIAFLSFTVNAGYIPSVNPNNANVGNFKSIAASIIGTLKWVGYAIAIGMIIYVGIRYTMAAADEKASMKGVLVKVVIGSLIIAGSTMIVDAVLTLSSN